jgi:hypothetical protein
MNFSTIEMRALWMWALPLPALMWAASGMEADIVPGLGQWLAAALFMLVGVLIVFLLHVLHSVWQLGSFVDTRSGHVDLVAAWRGRPVLPQAAICGLLMLWVHASILGIPLLVELHRQTALEWHDGALWLLERPLFDWIRDLHFGPATVAVFDLIYGLMWVFVIGVLVVCVERNDTARAVEMTITVSLLFHARVGIGLLWPTAGPAIFQPAHFEFLEGSAAAHLQEILVRYHEGLIAQNGLIPGLVAMPSLHVGFTWLAGRYLVEVVPKARAPVVGWLLLTWFTTAVLGWHYLSDGFGGIAAAVACRWLARRIALSALSERRSQQDTVAASA